MSTALFLYADKPLPKDFLEIKKRLLYEKNIYQDVQIKSTIDFFKQYNLTDYGYYFDSMWILFSDPLSKFVDQPAAYKAAKRYLQWIHKLLTKLLKKSYTVALFLGNCHGKNGELSSERKTLAVNELLNDNTVFEYRTVYNVVL